MSKDLERGYSDTGYIPEEFDDLSKLNDMEKRESQYEKHEKEMAKKFGFEIEQDVGGFLERNNTDDRY